MTKDDHLEMKSIGEALNASAVTNEEGGKIGRNT